MTTIDTRPDSADAAADDAPGESAAASFFVGAAAWVTTADHKRIGRMYAGFGLLALLATAALGAVLGLERADDGSALLDADSLLQMFQAYRVGLVFATIIPLGLGLAIAVVPLQLGARSLAFPRLALTGFYSWIGGLALTMVALGRNGGIGGGDDQAIDLFLAGHGLMILGLLASAGCVATSVLTTRAPGMTMRRVPLFTWSALIAALGMLLALPVLFGAIVYVFLDHRYEQACVFASLLFMPPDHLVVVLQRDRTGERRGIERQQPHATAPGRSWRRKKCSTSLMSSVVPIGSRIPRNVLP